jgi:hypothetical protein
MELSFGPRKRKTEKPTDEEVLSKLTAKPTPTPSSKLASKINVKKPQGQSKKPERWTPEEHSKFI